MKPRTFLRTAATAVAAALLGTGCAPERATAPSADVASADVPAAVAQQNAKGGTLFTPIVTPAGTTVSVAQRDKPLKQDVVVTQTITPRGGQLHIGAAGLTVYFAPGAVTQPLTVTATAYAGTSVAYSFEPHGTVFHAPVYVVQDLQITTVKSNMGQASDIAGAYMPDGIADLSPNGTALVSEIHTAEMTKGHDYLGKLVLTNAIFEIQHFSGYILTGGRGGNGH